MILLKTATQTLSSLSSTNLLAMLTTIHILDHIWTNQLYDTFNGIFLVDIIDHYTQYFTIVSLN